MAGTNNKPAKMRPSSPVIPGRGVDWQTGAGQPERDVYKLLRELERNKAEIGEIDLTNLSEGDLLMYGAAKPAWVNTKHLTGSLTVDGVLTITVGNIGQVTKTSDYTLTAVETAVWGNAAAGAFTLTLPTAVGIGGRRYTIKKIDTSAASVTLATSAGQTIDGGTTAVITIPYTSLDVTSDGANWFIT